MINSVQFFDVSFFILSVYFFVDTVNFFLNMYLYHGKGAFGSIFTEKNDLTENFIILKKGLTIKKTLQIKKKGESNVWIRKEKRERKLLRGKLRVRQRKYARDLIGIGKGTRHGLRQMQRTDKKRTVGA